MTLRGHSCKAWSAENVNNLQRCADMQEFAINELETSISTVCPLLGGHRRHQEATEIIEFVIMSLGWCLSAKAAETKIGHQAPMSVSSFALLALVCMTAIDVSVSVRLFFLHKHWQW